MSRTGHALLVGSAITVSAACGDAGAAGTGAQTIDQWMTPQAWVRASSEPVLSLGPPGTWDDTHIFAPCVVLDKGRYLMWYSAGTGGLEHRVMHMGLATSDDGVQFVRHGASPVLRFGDGRKSVLTPAVLRNTDGSPLREHGRLRMWFAASDLTEPGSLHTLHETSSPDGTTWSDPSPALIENVYAPTIIRDDGVYRMWFTDVSQEPWCFRHASSVDGSTWSVDEEPVLVVDQEWEERRLFYPTVLRHDGVYLMWYGAYWAGHPAKTALGLAVSLDGLEWRKNPHNPVVRPDPRHSWESHYTTSQSLLRSPDGSWRIWYASRKEPPHVNKYFAIGAAQWVRPDAMAGPPSKRTGWHERAPLLQDAMRDILTLPPDRIDLTPRTHNTLAADGYTIESITYASEPGSRVTALLYLPAGVEAPVPAIVVACGHGGSKSCLYAQYAGQLYAKLGFACLAVDTIGEEERHAEGRMGTRAHDLYELDPAQRIAFVQNELKRSILGKIVWDLSRGVDYLVSRPEIDGTRIGVVGYSLGGASAGCLAILDSRIHAAVICGWGFIEPLSVRGKDCTRLPYQAFAETMTFAEMTALPAPHANTLFLSGDSDLIIDPDEQGAALVRDVREGIAGAHRILAEAGMAGRIECRFVAGADHRPLFLTRTAVKWMQMHLMHARERRAIPDATVRFGDWVDSHGQAIEDLYNTDARERGTQAVDVAAVYYDPRQLACFPDRETPPTEYTFRGWVDTVLSINATRGD